MHNPKPDKNNPEILTAYIGADGVKYVRRQVGANRYEFDHKRQLDRGATVIGDPHCDKDYSYRCGVTGCKCMEKK